MKGSMENINTDFRVSRVNPGSCRSVRFAFRRHTLSINVMHRGPLYRSSFDSIGLHETHTQQRIADLFVFENTAKISPSLLFTIRVNQSSSPC